MISCAVTTSFLGCLVTMFLFIRYVWFLGLQSFGQRRSACCPSVDRLFPAACQLPV